MKSEINVTPLVDVVLVLLIIFMVVTPMLTSHSIQLPDSRQPAKEPQQPYKTIYMTRTATLFYEMEPVETEMLQYRLQELHDRRPDIRILLHADRRLAYAQVVEVMSIISDAGFDPIGLLAQPHN